jgi:protein-disulfide isomerase
MTNARQARTAREKAAQMRAEAARKEARQRAVAIIGAVTGVIAIVIAAGVLILTAQHDKQAKVDAAVAPPANLTNSGMLVGSAGAKVTLEIWEDFQCPACKQFEEANRAQIEAWVADGTVKVEYHPVAILDRYSSTEYSSRSLNAFAAVINTTPAAAEKYHDLLYTNQPPENSAGLTDAKLIELAVQAGAKEADISAAITGQKFRGWTQTVTDQFSKKGYNGTPTIVVNGKQVEDWSKLKEAVTAAKG